MTESHGSQKEFALHRGVSKQNVSHWKNKGLLQFSAPGIVDFVATDKRLSDHGIGQAIDDDSTVSADAPADEGLWSKVEAERIRENYSARLKRLEYDRAVEQVVLVDDVITHVRADYSLVRDRIRRISDEVTPQLVGVTNAEQAKAIVDAAVVAALTELSALEPGGS